MQRLLHGRVSIELHTLRSAEGQPLLLLHELGASVEAWRRSSISWPHGPVYGLDFAGHGKSGRVRGGAYYPEYFLADADLALEQIDQSCVIAGAGLGAYVGLLLAGARADQISTALLLPGVGLEGGGSFPAFDRADSADSADRVEPEGIEGFEAFIADASREYDPATDPLVARCERDLRPTDYVQSYAEAANPLLFSARVGRDIPTPDWWQTAFDANRGIAASEDPSEYWDSLASIASTSA